MCIATIRYGHIIVSFLVCAAAPGVADEVELETDVVKSALSRSFSGEILDVRVIEGSQPQCIGVGDTQPRDTLDLSAMSRWALRGLTKNPDSETGYTPRFALWLLSNPPYRGRSIYDISDVGARMSRSFIYLRRILAIAGRHPVEQAVNDRLLTFLSENGLFWMPAEDLALPVGGTRLWTNALMMHTLAEHYASSGEAHWKQRARRVFEGIREHLVAWKPGMAYCPYWETNLADAHVGGIYGPNTLNSYLVGYWEATGDSEALDLAIELAEGVLGHAQPMVSDQDFREDGGYLGHVHVHTRCMRGIIATGLAAGNLRYVEWGKRVYDVTKERYGVDTGWFSEWAGVVEGIEPDGETCVTSDMAGAAADLGNAGYRECYDDLERYLRNYLRWAQFFVTPEFEALYRERHGAEAELGLEQVREWQGAFVGSPDVNDLYSTHHQDVDMMGCCVASANLILWHVWRSVVTKNDRGLFVNMSINHETPELKVVSYVPEQGRLTVVAQEALHEPLFLRPPSWVPRPSVRAYRNGTAFDANWLGAYVHFEDVEAGDELTITYPLIEFTQKVVTTTGDTGIGRTVRQTWVGNTIVDVEPRGEVLPIMTGPVPELPPLP